MLWFVDGTNHNVARESSSQHRASGGVDGRDDREHHHGKLENFPSFHASPPPTHCIETLRTTFVIFPGIKSNPWKNDNIAHGSVSSTVDNLLSQPHPFILFALRYVKLILQ